jgi:ABC-type microcin C transport system permease subunit YejB
VRLTIPDARTRESLAVVLALGLVGAFALGIVAVAIAMIHQTVDGALTALALDAAVVAVGAAVALLFGVVLIDAIAED